MPYSSRLDFFQLHQDAGQLFLRVSIPQLKQCSFAVSHNQLAHNMLSLHRILFRVSFLYDDLVISPDPLHILPRPSLMEYLHVLKLLEAVQFIEGFHL